MAYPIITVYVDCHICGELLVDDPVPYSVPMVTSPYLVLGICIYTIMYVCTSVETMRSSF